MASEGATRHSEQGVHGTAVTPPRTAHRLARRLAELVPLVERYADSRGEEPSTDKPVSERAA
jgi:hypothetical protein